MGDPLRHYMSMANARAIAEAIHPSIILKTQKINGVETCFCVFNLTATTEKPLDPPQWKTLAHGNDWYSCIKMLRREFKAYEEMEGTAQKVLSTEEEPEYNEDSTVKTITKEKPMMDVLQEGNSWKVSVQKEVNGIFSWFPLVEIPLAKAKTAADALLAACKEYVLRESKGLSDDVKNALRIVENTQGSRGETSAPSTQKGRGNAPVVPLTDEENKRMVELSNKDTLTDEEDAELTKLEERIAN